MILFTAALISACNGPMTAYTGHNTYEYMALDGTRSWRYSNDDSEFDLSVEKLNVQEKNGTEIVTLEYAQFEPYELLGAIMWSSDSRDGIMIHGYSIEGETMVEFSNPILVAEYRMVPGDFSETESDGTLYTSTFESVESCPNLWVDEDWDCLKFTIESDSETSTAPFIGQWWLANAWGASIFTSDNGPFSSARPWVLSQAQWDGSD